LQLLGNSMTFVFSRAAAKLVEFSFILSRTVMC